MLARRRTRWTAALMLGAVLAAPGLVRGADAPPPPYPPYPPPPPVRPAPPPGYVPPPPRYIPPPRVAPPPPLSPVMRAIYAPFYVAGLVVRYGVYYVIVAPLEVFGRTIDYGVKGGVEPPPPRDRGDDGR
jgi:hypothetical protein